MKKKYNSDSAYKNKIVSITFDEKCFCSATL